MSVANLQLSKHQTPQPPNPARLSICLRLVMSHLSVGRYLGNERKQNPPRLTWQGDGNMPCIYKMLTFSNPVVDACLLNEMPTPRLVVIKNSKMRCE
jgi:hypothetical protein